MDAFKAETAKNYTAWDLNCPKVYHGSPKLKQKFKRTARRKNREKLKKVVDK